MFIHTALARVPLIFDSLVTLLMLIVGAGLGCRLLQWLRLNITDALERGLFAATVGIGLLSFLPFTLFALGIGHPPAIVIGLLALAIVLLPDERRVVQGAVQEFRSSWRAWRQEGPKATWALALLAAPLLLLTFLMALCPPTDPDGLHYHLTAPLRYLAAGHFYYLTSFLHTNWPLGVEMLFGIGLAFNLHYAAGLVQFSLGLLLMVGVYALGRRLASPLVGWLAAALIFVFIRSEMSWAYIDVGLSLYTLMAAYAFYLGWQRLRENRRDRTGRIPTTPADRTVRAWWTLSAVLAGLTAGAKLSGLLVMVLLAVMVFAALFGADQEATAGERFRSALGPTVGYVGVGLLVVLPWYVRCWAMTGDPLYPYLAAHLGGRDWDPAYQKRLNEYWQMFNTFRSHNPSPQMVMRLRAIACLFFAALGFGLCLWRGSRPVRPLIAFVCALGFFMVLSIGINVRYFLPLYPFFSVLLFWALRRPLERSTPTQWAAVGAVALWLWGLHHLPSEARLRLHNGRAALPVALGLVSRDAFYTQRLPIYPTLQWSNDNLPSNAAIALGVLDAYASLTQHASLTTNLWTQNSLRFDDYAQTLSDFQRLHVTHLVLHDDHPLTPQEWAGMDKEARVRATVEHPKLVRLSQEYGTPVYRSNGYTLYALSLPTRLSSAR